ncbi:MAG: hypothetical protein KF726_10240 [Anaerolineae bacterium]|nr:hypothetical protein [Anaerolineae bacterium]
MPIASRWWQPNGVEEIGGYITASVHSTHFQGRHHGNRGAKGVHAQWTPGWKGL